MKKTFQKISLFIMVFVSFFAISLVVGCNKAEEFVNQGEVGMYYAYDDENSKLTLDENKFTLESDTVRYFGTYSYDGLLKFTFDGESSQVVVQFDKLNCSFTYKGKSYMFYGDKDYTVTFNGTSLAAKTVKNGAYCDKPVDPTKTGYTFINWYTDAKFTKLYDFSGRVTGDTTIYARFETNTDPSTEFTVNFVTGVEGVEVASMTTFHNTIYNLPEVNAQGKTFVGWWVSSYNDANKLSYQYNEMMDIDQNITLYAVYQDNAPVINYADGKITWDNKGVNKQYAVNVKSADDLEADSLYAKRVQSTSVDFNFDNYAAGNYIIEVQCGDYTGKLYYANKLLATVCKISVDGFKVTWNKVPNATNYEITVVCGNSEHKHEFVELGDVNEYDFSDCTMPADGINFTVYASATGYTTSQSATVNEYKGLDKVQNVALAVKDNKQYITWDAVKDATGYTVKIVDDEKNVYNYATETNSYDASAYYGKLEVTVTPVLKGYYSFDTTESLNKTILSTPTNISLSGYDVTWDAVKDAVSYNITIGGKKFTSKTNKYSLTAKECEEIEDFKITVQAVAASEANNSFVSDETLVTKGSVTTLTYANNVISWNSVAGITKYALKIDDEDVIFVEGKSNYTIGIPSGDHTIKVTTVDNAGTYNLDFDCECKVTTYAIDFNVNGGDEVESLYFVAGDTIPSFTEGNRDGYDFKGWYSVDNEGKSTGELFTADTFNFGKDITVIASWANHVYNVTFDYGVYGSGETSGTATFLQAFTFPVPETTETLKVFAGWYSNQYGQGFQYTDEFGKSISTWKDYSDATLYAYWVDVLSFKAINNGNAYSVSKGTGIALVTEITIPDTYEGKPVTTIEANGFASCSKLVKINIPETIQNVEVGSAGPNGTGSCFQYCSVLEGVYVYEVEGAVAEDVKYSSIDGVLIYKNEYNGYEIKYFPYNTKAGTYIIPSIVTTIPINAFKSCTKITEVVIPATVTKIDNTAFYGCSKLTTITFLAADEGQEEKELVIGENVFQSNTTLEVINLPARLSSFNTNVFTSCTKLREVNIVGNYSATKYKSTDGVLLSADGTELIFMPRAYVGKEGAETTYTTPVGVTKICASAFEGVKTLTEVNISGQVTYIAENAFKSCSALLTVNFLGQANDMPLTICTGAFQSCTGLTEITLPYNLKELQINSFASTSKLTKVNLYAVSADIDFAVAAFGTVTTYNPTYYVTDLFISKDVHEFDITGVFGGAKLANVTVEEGNQYFKAIDDVLYDKDVTKIVFYPLEKEGEFQIPSTIKEIGAGVFTSRTALTSITIPKSVVKIGENAFQSCTKLAKIVFEAGGTEDLVIEKAAFYGCSACSSIEFPSRLKSIGANAFYSCSGLTSIEIPEGVTSVGEYAFRYCSKALSVSIPASLEDIPATTSTLTSDTEARIRVFDNMTVNMEFIVAEGNPNYTSIGGILYKKIKDKDTGETTSLELVTCPGGMYGSVSIPKNVSIIDNHAFYYCDEVTEIKFPEGVEGSISIGNYAFYYCKSINNIELPKGLTSIGRYAIYYCQGLESITIPNTVTTMAMQSVYYCYALKTVTFEEGGTEPLKFDNGSSSYPYGPFYGCSAIETVVLPDRLTEITDYCFYNLSSLKSVNIPNSVTRIGNHAFYSCKALTDFKIDSENSKLQSIDSYAFYYVPLTTFVMPNTVTTLGTYSFYYCKQLESCTLSTSLTAIPADAFYYCSGLKTVIVPEESVIESIGNYAFYYSGITSFVVPQTCKTIGNYAFGYCKSLSSVTFATKEVVENEGTESERKVNVASIELIGNDAFSNTILTSFTFPYTGKDEQGVYNHILLGNISSSTGKATTVQLFANCRTLTEVYISESVITIDKLFNKCPSIKKVTISDASESFKSLEGQPIIMDAEGTSIMFIYGRQDGVFEIPEGVTSISDYAFNGQTNITKIIIPKTVKKIGQYAFQNCLGLEEVIFDDACLIEGANIGTYTFADCRNLKKVVLPTALDEIPSYMFLSCISLQEVVFPSALTKINTYAFTNCSSLEEVNLPDTCINIGNYAFARTALKSVTLIDGVTYGTAVYQDCVNLTTVTSTGTPSSLGGTLFDSCTGLTEVVLPDGVATMPASLFLDCTNLKKVTIGKGATLISASMFKNCVNLESVVITDEKSIKSIGNYAFFNCEKITSFTIPANVTTIGTAAFYNTSIESIIIPKAVTTIGASTVSSYNDTSYPLNITSSTYTIGAFQRCSKLKTVDFSAATALTTIGACAFEGCPLITEINIPSTKLTKVYAAAFANCENLQKVTIAGTLATWGTHCCADCPNLTEFSVNEKTKVMSNYGFINDISLTSFTYPKYSTTTGTYTFRNCTSLENITWPTKYSSTVTFKTLGVYAFAGCTALKNIVIPEGVTTSGGNMFLNCTGLESITFPSTVTSLSVSICSGCTNLSSVTLGSKLTSIGISAFMNCTSLKSITVPATVTTIGKQSFYGSGLTSFEIGAKVTTVNGAAFNNCPDLTLTVNSGNKTYEMIDNALVKKTTKGIASIVNPSGDYVIPEGCTIENTALAGCENVTSITLPSTMTTIPTYAFAYFNGKKIILNEKTTATATYAFAYSAVEEIENTEYLQTIETYTFAYTTNLKTVELGEKLTTLKSYAFLSSSITSIEIPGSLESVGTYNATSMATDSSGTYGKVFYQATNLETVVLNEGIKYIGARSFEGTAVKEVAIPASVTLLGKYNFANCTELTKVEFKGNNIETISQYTFQGCTKLSSVNIPESVTVIDTHAFEFCESLKAVELPEALTTIQTNAFAGAGLESLKVPANVVNIFAYAFADCTNLKTVELNEGLETLGVVATTLGTSSPNGYVFQNCINLEGITLPSTLVSIGCNTFENCIKIKSIYIPNTVVMVGAEAFKGWTSSQTVYIEASLFDVTGSWYDAIAVTYAKGYWSNTDAKLVFDYEAN